PILGNALVLYLLMLPNLCLPLYTRIIGASQLWSIGVEEQFYLFWPLLVKGFNKRPLLLLLCFLGAIMLVARAAHLVPTLSCVKSLPLSTQQFSTIFLVCQ